MGPTGLRVPAIEWPSESNSGRNLAGIETRIWAPARFRNLEPNPAPVQEDATDLATSRSELLEERIGLIATVKRAFVRSWYRRGITWQAWSI